MVSTLRKNSEPPCWCEVQALVLITYWISPPSLRWRCLPTACRGCTSAISGSLETPICPCNTHWRQQFYFWSGHGHCGSLPKASVHSRMSGPVALWAGINKQRAVCPDSRSAKVNQSNSVSVDWQGGAQWSWPVGRVLTCKCCIGIGRSACTIWNLKRMMHIRHYYQWEEELAKFTVWYVSAQFCVMIDTC